MINVEEINTRLGNDVVATCKWALELNTKAICTTNFRPFEAVILHILTQIKPNLVIIWMDHGYNTKATYKFADQLTDMLDLNLHIYHPKRSRAHREAINGIELPQINTLEHELFTHEVKLEPFERVLQEISPNVWFTSLRASDTAHRAGMQPVSINKDNIIKVAPLLSWSSKQMHEYLLAHNLPNNFDYFDPTKVAENRECGLHTQH